MKQQRGFSLVELMVAITLGLIATAAVMSIFVGTRNASQATSGMGALTDSGRFALNFIQYSARSAGYMACNTAARQTSILNAGTSPLPFNYTESIGGFEANGTGSAGAYTILATPAVDGTNADWAAGTDPTDYTGGLDPALNSLVVKGNDVFIIRSTLPGTQSTYVTNIASGAANFQVNLGVGLSANQLAVISDCAKSVVFQIGGVSGPGANAVVSFSLGGSTPGNAAGSFPVTFAAGSQVTALDTVAYYIGVGSDGDSALFSYDLNGTGTFTANELVPDIENMQVLYGLDTSQTQSVSNYVTADQVTNFNNVMSVKVAVLAASQLGAVPKPAVAPTYQLLGATITAPQDTRQRQVFEMTIALRNALN